MDTIQNTTLPRYMLIRDKDGICSEEKKVSCPAEHREVVMGMTTDHYRQDTCLIVLFYVVQFSYY